MATAPLLLVVSALLNQSDVPVEEPPPPTPGFEARGMPPSTAPGEGSGEAPALPPAEANLARPQVEPAKGALPQMHYDQVVHCGVLRSSPQVPSGQYRIQCNDKIKVCLATPTHVLFDDGTEGPEPLTRVVECATYSREDWAVKAREGYRFLPAIADAPPGWVRDERGRVMQVSFDLNRRVYLGAAYAPTASRLNPAFGGRTRADFGVAIEFPGEEGNVLNRIHLLESEIFLGASTEIDTTLIRYDWSVSRQAPLFWITTFFGSAVRHDFSFDAGGWFEALHLESVKRGDQEANNFLTLGSAQLTLDLWHSRDLVSYLRVRAGPAAEVDTARGFTSLKGQAALDGNLTFDADGFHHAHLLVTAEQLYFDPVVEGRAVNPSRLKIRAGYEVVFIAINDYPLSLVLDARATWRDDLPGVLPGWEYGGEAGLRFSFWAPARRGASPQKAN